jgi:hypothetical protein
MNDRIKLTPGTGFLAWAGTALAAAGVLMVVINVGLTPFLRTDVPYHEIAASSVFLWRQSLSAVAAVLLLVGSIGLFLHQTDIPGRFGTVGFVLAFLGSALLLANEWGQVFFVRDLARRAPDVLLELESADGPSLMDIGAMIALVTFTLGWIAFSVSMLLAGVYSRTGPILVIAGFLAIPILGAALPASWGPIVGSTILGCGWILLGRELYQTNWCGRSKRSNPDYS